MVTFSASLGVNMAALTELSGLFSGTLTPANVVYGASDMSYVVVVTSPVMHVDFSGSFQYDGGNLSGGTMNGITVAQDGTPAYSISDFSASVQTLLNDASASKVMSFFYGLFTGHDSINGSPGDDQLWALGRSDTITAGAGNDTLYSGAGAAHLIGGSGHDHFVFNNRLSNATVDTILNFQDGRDHIYLWEYVAKGFAMASHLSMNHLFFWTAEHSGGLYKSSIHLGREAGNNNQHIIYDRAHGDLYYHPGGAPNHLLLFAKLPDHPLLTYQDFSIIA